MDTASSIVPNFAEALICLPLLSSAIHKTLNYQSACHEVAAPGLPQPHRPVAAVIGLQFVASAMMLLGIGAWLGASALVVFTTLATLLTHRWWTMPQGMQAHHLQACVQNAAIVGGLLVVGLIDLVGWRGGRRS